MKRNVRFSREVGYAVVVFPHRFARRRRRAGLGRPRAGESGTLTPGRYRFSFDAGLFGPSSSGQQNAGYSFHLVLDTTLDGGDNGGGEPNPIPLPPAAWSGLLVLGAAGLTRVRRKLWA